MTTANDNTFNQGAREEMVQQQEETKGEFYNYNVV